MGSRERVRWGVIGIGGIASRRVVPEVLAHSRSAEVVAVMGPNADRTRALAEKLGVGRWYTREQDLLADEAVEAVYVATPNDLHLPQVLAAAGAGKHVLCEKPLGLDVAQAEEMVDACRRAGVLLGTAYMMRFHGLHRRAQQMVAEGALGRPVVARAQLSCWYPAIPGAWRQDPDRGGGGSLADMGSHCIDLLEMILGSRVREVSAFQGALVQAYPVEDTSAVLLRFQNGALGMVDTCFNVPDAATPNRLEVYGSEGSLLAEGTIGQTSGGSMVATLSPQGAYEAQQTRAAAQARTGPVTAEPVPLYAAEIDHLSDCIRAGREPEISGAAGLWNQRVLAAIYGSASTGRAVEVE